MQETQIKIIHFQSHSATSGITIFLKSLAPGYKNKTDTYNEEKELAQPNITTSNSLLKIQF